MIQSPRISPPRLASILLLMLLSNAGAVQLYWDGTSTDFSLPSAWSTVSNATTPNPVAIPGAADIATFRISGISGSTQTVNLNGTQSLLGITTANSSQFTTIRGGGTDQILNLGTSGINHTAGGLTIGSTTAGQAANISLQGGQTWTSSGTTVNPAGITIHNNVSLGVAGTHTLTLNGANTNPTINGNISDGSGVLNITKSGGGATVWFLRGNNEYSGTTTVSGGVLAVGNNSGLGSTTGGSVVTSGTLAVITGFKVTGETATISGTGDNNTGALRSSGSSGTAEWDGTVILNGTTPRIGATAGTQMIFSGPIQGGTGQNLFVTGNAVSGFTDGIVVISAAEGVNTYTGLTNIVRGTLRVGATNALPVGTVVDVHALSAAVEGATFDLNNFDQTVAGIQNTGGTNVAVTITNSGASMRTLTINNPVARSYTGVITGANLALTKTGAGTMTLSGANTYGGVTHINAGTLALGSAGTLSGTSEVMLGGGTLNVSAKAGGLTLGAGQKLSGSGTVTGDLRIDGQLAIGNSPGTVTFDDDLTVGATSVSTFEFTSPAFEPGTFDLAQGTGDALTLGGTLNLMFSGGTYANVSVNIFPGFGSYAGSFSTVNFSGLGLGQSALFDPLTGLISIVPEPGVCLLMLAGACSLVLRRRRNR